MVILCVTCTRLSWQDLNEDPVPGLLASWNTHPQQTEQQRTPEALWCAWEVQAGRVSESLKVESDHNGLSASKASFPRVNWKGALEKQTMTVSQLPGARAAVLQKTPFVSYLQRGRHEMSEKLIGQRQLSEV